LRELTNLTEAERLYYVVYPAESIAECAMFVSHERDRREDLSQQMDAIKKREGLAKSEDYMIGDGPADYQGLSREREDLYDKVKYTVMIEVGKRYGLNDEVRLYEEDRERFNKLLEEGREAVSESIRQNRG